MSPGLGDRIVVLQACPAMHRATVQSLQCHLLQATSVTLCREGRRVPRAPHDHRTARDRFGGVAMWVASSPGQFSSPYRATQHPTSSQHAGPLLPHLSQDRLRA